MKKRVHIIIPILCLVLALAACGNPDDHQGKAKTPSGSSAMKGRDYLDVYKSFSDKGFTNIKYDVLEDLVTGWLTKDGEVEKVTVGGDVDYASDRWVAADTEVVISYHTFPTKKQSQSTDAVETSGESPSSEESTAPLDKKVQKIINGSYTVGSSIRMGKYNNLDIEWIVMEIDDVNHKILVRAKEVFECRQFNDVEKETTWKESCLREWLNSEFYDNSFSEAEKCIISDNKLEFGDASVTDKIFIPTYDYSFDIVLGNRRAKATRGAFENGLILYADHKIDRPVKTQRNRFIYGDDDPYTSKYSPQNSYCDWWLISTDGLFAQYIDGWGDFKTAQPEQYTEKFGVRPMMWIEIQ